MVEVSSIPLWTVLIGLLGVLGTIMSVFVRDPKSEYLDDIPDVRGERLDNVSSSVAPIVSEAYQFMRDTDGESAEQLDQEDQAAVAVTEALADGESLSDVQEAVEAYLYPDRAFRRCRKGYRVLQAASFIAIIVTILSVGILLQFPQEQWTKDVSSGLFVFALLVVVFWLVGLVVYGYYVWKIDEMVESVELVIDS